MQAKETTLQKLIEGQKQFQVPLYQRTFSWQEKELGTLWTDVLDQANALQDGAGGAGHFLGSVVLAPSPVAEPATVERWVIVDGQQRLTTLMLALCALRDHLIAEAPGARDRINELYLTNKFQAGLDHFRLLPTQADRPAFFACVTGAESAGGGDNIGAAYRFFRTALVAADDPADPHDLTRIENVLLGRLSIVEVKTDRDDDVYRIFESLNNTGRQLTQADLIRNYVFMCLPTSGEQVYAEHWLPMQDRLGDHLELLFFLDLILRGRERAKRSDVYGEQRRRLEPFRHDEREIEREVAELERRSRHLRRILTPAEEPNPAIRTSFERLNTWGAQTTYPLLMHLLDVQERGGASAGEVAQAIAYVESFLVRRMICNIPTNNLNRIFSTIVGMLREDLPIADAVRFALSDRRRFWPTDRELRDAVRSKPFYWYGRPEQQTLILLRLEERLSGRSREQRPSARLVVEHVMPEHAADEWFDAFYEEGEAVLAAMAEEVEGGITADELYEHIGYTLGNLTLAPADAELSVRSEERRKRLTEATGLAINQEVAEAPRWGVAEMRQRAERLADLAVDVWPGPPADGGGAVQQRDWSLLHQALAALPAGSWTTYGDLAALIGSHAVPVGTHLASTPGVVNAHRVLGRGGKVSPSFRWSDPHDTRDPHDLLRAEGVRFDDQLTADPAQRMSAQDLAELLGVTAPAGPSASAVEPGDGEVSSRQESFLRQLRERQPPVVQDGVRQLLEFWRSLGNTYLFYGAARETSCALMIESPQAVRRGSYWPFTIYPGGTVEVVFQHLRQRPPFDDEALRDQFRRLCNEAAGVDIPPAKLRLRPSFPLDVLADPAARDKLFAALEWFAVTARRATRD